jgi:hypothetical protein
MVMPLPPVSKMAPDTRKTYHDRATQIAFIADALKVAAAPPSDDNDGERHECDHEMVYLSVLDCTHNDVVVRAVAAAKRLGDAWGASVMIGAAAEREKLNKLRAANAKKYGARK